MPVNWIFGHKPQQKKFWKLCFRNFFSAKWPLLSVGKTGFASHTKRIVEATQGSTSFI